MVPEPIRSGIRRKPKPLRHQAFLRPSQTQGWTKHRSVVGRRFIVHGLTCDDPEEVSPRPERRRAREGNARPLQWGVACAKALSEFERARIRPPG